MIVGKWALISNEEYYNSGQVIEVLNEFFLLVRIRSPGPSRIGLFEFPMLSYETDSAFFDTEEELDAFIKWLDTPEGESKLKVVPIKKEGER